MADKRKCGFTALISEIPKTLKPVDQIVIDAGYDSAMVKRVREGGLRFVPVSDRQPGELLQKALERLLGHPGCSERKIGGVLVAHSRPQWDLEVGTALDWALRANGLGSVPKLTVSGQPCAILHFALRLGCLWARRLGSEAGVAVVGIDVATSVADRVYFGSVMGDAAVAGLLSSSSEEHIVLASYTDTQLVAVHGERSSAEDIQRFRQINPLAIRSAVLRCLDGAGLSLDDLRWIVPHTPYTMIWDTIAPLLEFPREKILTSYIGETGHLNSNDSLAHYIRAVNEGIIESGDYVMLVNPGFGGTRGCTLMSR